MNLGLTIGLFTSRRVAVSPPVLFEDTFSSIDSTKWQHRTGWMAPTVTAWNDYASNATTVVDSALAPELYSISGGVLSLSARRSVAGDATAINSALSWSGQTMRDWLGPMMVSRETFTYGHFQFRVRVPSPTKGMFPAIWFYGAQDGSAPPEKQQVEIDLWELFGYPSGKPISTTIHYRNISNEAERPHLSVGDWDVDTTGWHVYALDWQPTYLRFWYDDILLAEVTGEDATWLNVPMRIIMQAMVGAAWFPSGSEADETTASPNGMEVDYVRVHSGKEAFSSAPSDAPVIAADGADGKVTLSMDHGDFVARAVSYETQRSDDGTSGWTAVDDRWFASLDVAATNGSLIYFRARAKNAAGVGPWSTVVSAVAGTAIVPPDWGSNLARWFTGSVSPWALSGGELVSSTGSWAAADLILQEWLENGVTYTVTINCTLPAGYINVGPNGGVASFDATDQPLVNGANTLTWTMSESVPRFSISGESNGFILHSISIEETAGAPAAVGSIGLQRVQEDTGDVTLSAAPFFSGSGITYSLVSPPAGVTINSGSGVIAIDTDVLAKQAATALTVRATNTVGHVDQPFTLSVGPQRGIAIPGGFISPLNGANRTSLFAAAAAAGYCYVRADARREAIETGVATYDWTLLDDINSRCVANGMKPWWIAMGTPAHTGQAWNAVPSDTAQWAAFCAALATRYPDSAAIEIWNEPNHDAERFLNPDNSGSVYAWSILAPAYTAIKAAVPGMQVVYAGLTPSSATDGSGVLDYVGIALGTGEKLNGATNPGFTVTYGSAALTTPSSRLRITNSAADYSAATMTITTVVGKRYRFSATQHGGTGTGVVKVRDGATEVGAWYGAGAITPLEFIAASTTTTLEVATNTNTNGHYAEFSAFTFVEKTIADYCDAWAHHPYNWPVYPAKLWAATDNWLASEIGRDLKTLTGNTKPVHMTEVGAPTAGTDLPDGSSYTPSAANQAAILLECWDAGAAGDWNGVQFDYSLVDEGGSATETERWFGIYGPFSGGMVAKAAVAVVSAIKRGT